MSPAGPPAQGATALQGEPLALDRHPLVFGCGAAKTGTHSLAGIFERDYRAVHEPEVDELCNLVVDLDIGAATTADAERYLRDKDARLLAQVDSSQLNVELIELTVALYPSSRWVLTVREPYGWLDSFYDHHLARGGGVNPGFAGGWKRLTDHRALAAEHSSYEAQIAAHGFGPIAPRFERWSARIDRVTAAVPSDRLLVLRTDELASSLDELAAFAGVPAQTLDAGAAHSFPASERFGLLTTVDRAYLDDLVQELCQPHLDRIFGDR
jgi:hypothetical protein